MTMIAVVSPSTYAAYGFGAGLERLDVKRLESRHASAIHSSKDGWDGFGRRVIVSGGNEHLRSGQPWAALASFMEKVLARSVELKAAAARLNQFRGLPNVNDGPFAHTPTNGDQMKIETAAERVVAASLHLENDADRKLLPGRPMTLVKSDAAA
jgi:hypothetical protein